MVTLPRTCPHCQAKLMHYGACNCHEATLAWIEVERATIGSRLERLKEIEREAIKKRLQKLGAISPNENKIPENRIVGSEQEQQDHRSSKSTERIIAEAINCIFFPSRWDHVPTDKCMEAAKLATENLFAPGGMVDTKEPSHRKVRKPYSTPPLANDGPRSGEEK